MAMRKRLGPIAGTLLSVALLLAGTGPALAVQPSEQQVRKLMDTIGLGRSLSQMNSQIATSMKQSLPCVASNYWQDFVDQNGSKEFIGRLVPVYQRYFTADEVDGMVTFYSSPLGQKVLTEMPAAMAEANQAGQQWSHEHGQQMIAKLEQAGTLTADGRCPATGGAVAASSSVSPAVAAVATGDKQEDLPSTPAATRGHRSSHSGHRHVPVKKKLAPKKSGSSKSSTSKVGAKASTKKSAPAKASSAKSPAKAKAKHPAAAKPAAAAGT